MRVCAVNGTSTRVVGLDRGDAVVLGAQPHDRPALGRLVGEAREQRRRRELVLGHVVDRRCSSVASRLPIVIVPVLSSKRVETSPAASTARPDIASTLCCTSRSMPGDADRRQQTRRSSSG